MEDLFGNAVVEPKSSNLEKKVAFAISLIKSASAKAAEIGQVIEVCYSGGKDSDVILELARMSGVPFRAIYKNTTIDPPGTVKHCKDNNVEVVMPKVTFRQLIEKSGYPSRLRRMCCDHLKEYKIMDYAIIGVRRDESAKRAKRYKEPEICRVYNSKEKARLYMPILEWTLSDVEEFIKRRNIKCAPVYYDECGNFHPERRLGCMCCPLASQKKRLEEFTKYPNMLKLYTRAGKVYMETHPDHQAVKCFKNEYEMLVYQLFCNNLVEFESKFGSNLFDKGMDCKKFLEDYFNIKFV